MSEHFRFQKVLWHRGAVYGYHGAAAASAVVVDELCDEFFSGTAFARDEDGCVGFRYSTCEFHRTAESGGDPQHLHFVAEPVLARRGEIPLPRFPGDQDGVGGAADQNLKLGGGEGLREVIPCSGPEHLETRLNRRVARHHDRNGVAVLLQARFEELRTRDTGHVLVDEYDVVCASLEEVERLVAFAAHLHVVPFGFQECAAALSQSPLVVNDENPHAGLGLAVQLRELRGKRLVGSGHAHRMSLCLSLADCVRKHRSSLPPEPVGHGERPFRLHGLRQVAGLTGKWLNSKHLHKRARIVVVFPQQVLNVKRRMLQHCNTPWRVGGGETRPLLDSAKYFVLMRQAVCCPQSVELHWYGDGLRRASAIGLRRRRWQRLTPWRVPLLQ